ncbi:unnamed protein product [Wuchereria bancrofti]|uniref:Uncharacterized protein n=1 Tax=Wuchereria bancrofti TaxID=6293 RepID=A0A3P7FUU4_WUCBA|nr:unnamed protein product [Wuchereria bancrofti]
MTVQNVPKPEEDIITPPEWTSSEEKEEKQKIAMKKIEMDKFEEKKKIEEDNIVKAKMSNNKSNLVENREKDQIKQKDVAKNSENLRTLSTTTENATVIKKMGPELEKTIEKPAAVAATAELVTSKMKNITKNDTKIIDNKKNETNSDRKEINKEVTQK